MFEVLITDDEPLMRQALTQMIGMVDGFEVCGEATTGNEAIKQVKALKPDIVFMDVVMPDEDGIKAAQKIREILPHVTIYLVSAYNTFDFAKEAIHVGVDEYLLKPLSFSKVKRLLESFRGLKKRRNQTFDELCAVIDCCDYAKMYYDLPRLIQTIKTESWEATDEIIDYYYTLENQLFVHYNCLEETNYINRPAGKMLPVGRWLAFRLYATMDLIYRHNACDLYPVMKKSFAYIDHHIGENIGLREVRENSGLSQGYLSRIFKKTLGISVMTYIHLCRMMQAKWYFCVSNDSVTDVTYRLGYNESSYFSKLFKKYEHMTISQYKKIVRKEKEEQKGIKAK
jgi:two-component system response regulator YesN